MPQVLVAECKLEVSTFNPALTHYEDFKVLYGPEILNYHRRARHEIGGALSVWDARPDIEVVPTYSACSHTSGGTLAARDWRRIAEEFLSTLRQAPPVDAAYFSLHGAMAAENEDDPEGYLLQETRKILGERIPVVASYDLHGILTERMVEHSDAFVVFHTYPHVDLFQTGERAGRVLLRILDRAVRPVTAKVFIPALVRGDELITETGLIGHAVRAAQEIEKSAGGLAAGLFWGNPFTDVPALGTNSFAITDDDPARAEREALRLADLFWQHHQKMQVPLTSLDEALRLAMEAKGGTTILVDAADAPSSGAPGDSNAILKGLLAKGYAGEALIPIVDPAAVRAAFAAGVGKTVRTRVGGAFDSGRHQPVEIEGRVQMLSDGRFKPESPGDQWYSGDTAVLRVGSITLIVTSRAVSLYDRSLFYAHGQDPTKFDLVVVKSPHCQHHMFNDRAARYVNVDAPGSTSANLRSLGHTRCPRPIFPLDEGVTFTPQARLFKRPGG